MARRRRDSWFDIVVAMPWPAGAVLGILAFLAIRYGIGYFVSHAGGPMWAPAERMFGPMFAPIAWMALGICWLAALFSFLGRRRRQRLLEVQSGVESITAMSWREFEMLVGEAYRRQGYSVEETGLGGADGGIDLILRKDGRSLLVQCKQWKARQVNVSVVREMWGLVAHHGAGGAKIVCAGAFTQDAAAFAAGKAIELVTGEALLALVRSGQSRPDRMIAQAAAAPAPMGSSSPPQCPRCGESMVSRANKKTGESFWGCGSYPRCYGTLPA